MTASADISLAALLVVSLSFAMLGAASAASASATPAQSHAYVSPEAKVGFNPQPDPPGYQQRPGDGSVKPAAQH